MRIRGGYHHVHLTSPDPAAAASWYVRFLGAEIVSDADLRGARNVRVRVISRSLGLVSLYLAVLAITQPP